MLVNHIVSGTCVGNHVFLDVLTCSKIFQRLMRCSRCREHDGESGNANVGYAIVVKSQVRPQDGLDANIV
ncbi:MAG: hypothetical protein ACKPKO_26725, partial [Candidatus Fonsibacter sp.]